MKTANDNKTPDLLGDTCDLAGPVPAKPTSKERAALRALRFKEKNGVRALTVHLPIDLYARFEDSVKKRAADNGGLSKSQVIAKLIESQLLRKR